jgi:uncharacterized protein YndB with AHSA1/START domain
MNQRRYQLPDGRTLWVAEGLGKWMTMDSTPTASGRHKFTSKALPARVTREEAQADLDAYAKKGRLQEVTS